jgi:serralysin
VDLGGGDDRLTVAADSIAYSTVHGGPGDDILLDCGHDVLYGDAGDDIIDGAGGAYSEGAHGGPGDDTLLDCGHACHQG